MKRWLRMCLETQVSLPLFTIVLLAVVWATTLHFIDSEEAAARQLASDSSKELIATYEAQVARSVNGIEQTLQMLKYSAEREGPLGALPELQSHGLLPSGLVFVVSIVDAQGDTVASNPVARPINVGTQEYFRFHQEHRSSYTFISRAMRDQANLDWHLHFTRRLEDARGEFAGVAIVEVEPTYFTSGYERSRLGEHGMLGLVGDDGVVRALRVGDKQSFGQQLDMTALQTPRSTPVASIGDGVKRYTAVRQMAGLHLSALVGLAEDEQMTGFAAQRRQLLLDASIATAVLILLAALVWACVWQGAKARRRIRRAQETYAAASESNMDSFFVLRAIRNKEGVITDFKFSAVNSRAEQLTGRTRSELRAQTLCNWMPSARHNGMFERLVLVTQNGGVHQEEGPNMVPQLHADWLHWQVVGVEGGVVAILRDISERKRAEERIYHMAHHDTLTGLPNRSLTCSRLEQAIAHAERTQESVLVAFIDLDSFKLVNDTLGHNAGDELLKEVAGRMVRCVRRDDTVGRFGGDEFVLVLPHVNEDPQVLAPVLDKILAAVVRPIELEGQKMQVSCSIGVAVYPRDGQDSDTLMLHADAAMYRAKESGKNNCQFYDHEMNAGLEEKLALTEGLRKALEEQQLFLAYQPKVSLASGRMFGVEALLRWQHPQRGLVSPAQFIPLAEENGLIIPIGEWALREACRQACAWLDAGLPPMVVSVNVSARQFDDPRLVERVAEALEWSGLSPQWLELELTESMIMRDVGKSVEKMRQLEAMGIALAIDDFGTGYSSLAALKSFPISRLKIDQSFVRDLAGSSDDQAITCAIISLSHQLDMRVIAEGVETEQQRSFLQQHGCDEIQGYLFSRPVPPQEITAMLIAEDTDSGIEALAP
ncbi:bifunctional diguanylate cyclase/phosphodiesterase [Pseudoduganella violaceinigra]|uniref:bifunctional diguanylate cyclase/phosphodiesterase n=1 Tax=Pseudoduganella violaceinigra TaxID=246602 RepID=UPI001E5CC3CB|nr:EAL domain-containing protein [Pseudoduganella violaceinigra]